MYVNVLIMQYNSVKLYLCVPAVKNISATNNFIKFIII